MKDNKFNILQRLVLPSQDFDFPDKMFYRGHGFVVVDDSLRFSKGGSFSTFSFYNGYSLNKWHGNTDFNDLFFKIDGSGEVKLSFWQNRKNCTPRKLLVKVVNLNNCDNIELSDFVALRDGILSVTIETLSDGFVKSAMYLTGSAPVNPVKLALVITHFNRVDELSRTVDKLKNEVLDLLGKDVVLYVVDNSKNSGLKGGEQIKVFENDNFGGAGGFTRGLLEAESEGFSHCLFMDDDASCESESIFRVYGLLQYASDSALAVAGSLLMSDRITKVWEKGACFDGLCRPQHHDVSVVSKNSLLLMEQEDDVDIYGSWWFFAFKISEIINYPFPFFVRGDDIAFSLSNKFKIITVNGIASVGERFNSKSGPLQVYLDARSHLVNQIVHVARGRRHLFSSCLRMFVSAIFSYRYSSAKAVILAMSDFLEGPDFFVRNMDMSQRFPVIKDLSSVEQLQSINYDARVLGTKVRRGEGFLRRWYRRIFLNGYLLPGFLMSNDPVYERKEYQTNLKGIFGHKKVVYVVEGESLGFYCSINRTEAFLLAASFLFKGALLYFNYRPLKADYDEGFSRIARKSFWADLYGEYRGR